MIQSKKESKPLIAKKQSYPYLAENRYASTHVVLFVAPKKSIVLHSITAESIGNEYHAFEDDFKEFTGQLILSNE